MDNDNLEKDKRVQIKSTVPTGPHIDYAGDEQGYSHAGKRPQVQSYELRELEEIDEG